jgi:hypothetical protein
MHRLEWADNGKHSSLINVAIIIAIDNCGLGHRLESHAGIKHSSLFFNFVADKESFLMIFVTKFVRQIFLKDQIKFFRA